MKDFLCECSNCGAVMIDENPQTDAKKYTVRKNVVEMISIHDEHGGFWACPNCKTDEYLFDYE